jgi:beta-glucosidase
MTLEEKLGQLTMNSGQVGPQGPILTPEVEQQIREGRIGSTVNLWGAATTQRVQHIAVKESRLSIPLLFA